MRRFALWLIGILIVAGLGGFLFLYWLFSGAQPQDRKAVWRQFYKESFSTHFRIPPEAEIVSATQRLDPFMGEYDRVIFRLPGKQTPAEWVAQIAKSSGIGSFRQSDTWYDASHRIDGSPNKWPNTITDSYLIRYLPGDRTYEAIWSWD